MAQRSDEPDDDTFHGFPHPYLAVDVVLLTLCAGALHVVLLRRTRPPFDGRWVLPGAFVGHGESPAAAVDRVLAEKVLLQDVFVEQLFTFGDPDRDPREHVVSIAYYALVPEARLSAVVARGALTLARVGVPWRGLAGGAIDAHGADGVALRLGFDHEQVIGTTVLRLRGKIDYAPVGFELLPREFTLLQLQVVHEAVLGDRVNKDSFRRRMLASGLLQPTGRRQLDVGHRPAELFRFRRPSTKSTRTRESRR